MEREIVYIAELDADVDDVVAAEYLHNKGVLKCVVLDPMPKTSIGKQRKQMLEDLGINVMKKMPPIAKYVFIGGALTEIARYITTHHIDCLVMNGGFVGSNIVPESDQLDKFKNKQTVRTFNFNCDVQAADRVLKSTKEQIGEIILVGKNVCHSKRNTEADLWNNSESRKLFSKYNVKPGKCQHDMLACHEGLAYIYKKEEHYCSFLSVYPFNEGLQGNMTKWGSKEHPTQYREVVAAVKLL